MAVDKLVDSTQLDADLTSVANAIRTKGGTSAQLAFPAGFVSAIDAIPTGGGADNILYSLPSATVFNGSSTYIDTGVKLMESTDSMFTVEITGINGAGVGANVPIFHCVTESGSYPGLAIQRKASGDTSVYAICGLSSTQVSTTIPVAEGTEFRIVIRRYITPSGTVTYYFEYAVDGVKKTAQSYTSTNTSNKNLLIGCYQSNNGTKGRYWKGTISDFKIRSAYMPNDYVEEYLTGTSNAEVLAILMGDTV